MREQGEWEELQKAWGNFWGDHNFVCSDDFIGEYMYQKFTKLYILNVCSLLCVNYSLIKLVEEKEGRKEEEEEEGLDNMSLKKWFLLEI